MCLTVKRGCKPEIAEKDILCFKIVRECSRKTWIPHYISIINYRMMFSYNTVINAKKISYPHPPSVTGTGYYELETPVVEIISDIKHLEVCNLVPEDIYSSVETIYNGFHSNRGFLSACFHNIGGSIKLCIIPKGAEYCLGDNHDIVSTQLIVFSNLKEYIKYKLRKK